MPCNSALSSSRESDQPLPWLRRSTLLRLLLCGLLTAVLAGCFDTGSSGRDTSTTDTANTPPEEVTGGLAFVSDEQWNEGAVRRVLHLFAFGGHASDAQIVIWADMAPPVAIAEILDVSEFHLTLSPLEQRSDVGHDGTLNGLSQHWSRDASDNPLRASHESFKLEQTSWRSPANLWYQATLTRGLNPVRQKIGLYLTNYHMAINQNTAGMINHQVARYYDDVMNAVASGQSFDQVLTVAASSSAVAQQYNHQRQAMETGVFRGNENFAREYFQLFFGILNSSADPNDPEGDDQYHEETNIPNMARLLTGIKLGGDRWDSPEKADVTYDSTSHHRGALTILGHEIQGETALEKLNHLGPLALQHPQSLQNLPVMIIRWLADDELMQKPGKKARLRAQWAGMEHKDLMGFLRAYAISEDFHSPDRVKYYSIFDRLMTVNNLLVTANADVWRPDNGNSVYNPGWDLWEHGFSVFVPYHDVFGGQTGLDAASSTDYFKTSYNMVTEYTWRFTRAKLTDGAENIVWQKRWLDTLPEGDTYTVEALSEWLWQRFVADDLHNFGPLERVHVYAFLASGLDPVRRWHEADIITDWEHQFAPEALEPGGALYSAYRDLANATIDRPVSQSDQDTLASRLGRAINFIVATPYMYFQEGR